MTRSKTIAAAGIALLAVASLAASGVAMAAERFAGATGATAEAIADASPAWAPAPVEQVKAQAFEWLAANRASAAVRAEAEAIWQDLPATATENELLLRLAKTFALVDRNAAELVALCAGPSSPAIAQPQSWLLGMERPSIMADNLRLLYARWLVDGDLYDEAREQLAGLSPQDVVAPTTLLFYQSVVHHGLLDKASGLESIGELLRGEKFSPRRYAALARLMQNDLENLKDDTLDHIARRMDDVRRRLELGRAGKNVRRRQDQIIESLDKLIKKMEDERQKHQQQANMLQSSSPAQDSKIMKGKGPGEVDRKHIGSESGWGNLPPKQREEAMQQIGREFPSHYREIIEQYYRRLAAEESER